MSGVDTRMQLDSRRFIVARLAYAIACAMVFGFAVKEFCREYMFVVLTQDSGTQAVLDMRHFDSRWLVSSLLGTNVLVRTCADLLLSNEMVILSSQLQSEIGASCGAAAQAVLVRSPTLANVRAMGLVAARDAVTPGAYASAEEAAPFEPWPLGIRLLAAERNLSKDTGTLPAALAPLVASDVDRALQSVWGRRFVAGLYLRQQGLRGWIQQLVQNRAPNEQHDFLQAVKGLAAKDG